MDHVGDAEDATPAPLPELTDTLSDAAFERARRAVRGPREARCDAFSSSVDIARKRCTANGRGTIGRLSRNNGRHAWEAWLDRRTGEGRLRVLPESFGT